MRVRLMIGAGLVLVLCGCAAADVSSSPDDSGSPVSETPDPGLAWEDLKDSDGDGLPDAKEFEVGTDPESPDTDGDGLDDLYELIQSITDPLSPTTYDGVHDSEVDLDKDGLSLTEEAVLGTDMLERDTDADGIDDGDEVAAGTDPLDKDSPGPLMIDGAVVVHDGGDTEATVTARGSDEVIERLNVVVSDDDGAWAESPARIGPTVSALMTTEPVELQVRYPESVAGGLTADGLVVAIEDFMSFTLDFVDVEHDASAGVFIVEHTLEPETSAEFILLDLEAHRALFE